MVGTLIMIFIVGFFVGGAVITIVCIPRAIGTLRIDDSADEPYMFVELESSSDLTQIVKQPYAIFRVRKENYIRENN